jgi:hypothetical protein
MSVLLPTLLKTTGDSSCLLLVLRACPPLLPSRLRHHLIAQNPMPSDVDVYTPIPRKYSKTSHADAMSPPLSALPKSPRERSHVSLSLSSLHDVHINPVLRDFFSSTCTDAAIILKNCERQGHVAPSFFSKSNDLAVSCRGAFVLFQNAAVVLSCVSRLLSKAAIMYTMSPRLPAVPKHRHTSSCVSLSSAFAAAIYKSRRGASSCTLQHTPKLQRTKN